MGDGPSESQAGDDPATFDTKTGAITDKGVGYGNVNTTTAQALADDPSIDPGFAEVQPTRSANTQSFTQQSQNYVDDFSGANIGSLPTSRSKSTASLPSTFERDYTKDYSDFTTADQLTSMSNSINNPLSNFLTSAASLGPICLARDLITGPKDNQQITGTMDYGIGMGMPSNDKDMTGRGLAVSNYSPFDVTQPQVDFGDINDVGDDGSESPQIIRRNPSDPVQDDPTDPILSDELASDYLQNPYYLYSGIGNQYQPYGYAQNTLVDLLRTRNMTQPQQRAANLGLFGNPGDFS